jgi:hypothetical protein
MTPINLVRWIILAVLLAGSLPAGQMAALAAIPAAPAELVGGAESISGSYVYLNTVISPDDCYTPGRSQTFCFQAISYTGDWDYVYYLWQRFPDDWTVNNIYVEGTPYCINGGTFSTFSWWGSAPNQVRIDHVRYQGNPNDTCTAYYCFEVTSGTRSPDEPPAWVSWNWTSSQYGSPPYFPCSSDGYTPAGQPACDEMTTPPAYIDRCPLSLIYLPVILNH